MKQLYKEIVKEYKYIKYAKHEIGFHDNFKDYPFRKEITIKKIMNMMINPFILPLVYVRLASKPNVVLCHH